MYNKKVLIDSLKNLGSAKAPTKKKDVVVGLNNPIQMSSMKQGGSSLDKQLSVKKSNIQGNGLFINEPIRKGDVIGLAHINNQATPIVGKNHNHSENNPTAVNISQGNKRYLVAAKDLPAGTEITTNYRLQPELEQPEDFMRNGGMTPQKDGYRTYSPFKNLPFIDIETDTIDTDNIVYDLQLVANNGVTKNVQKNTGLHKIPGASVIREIPIDLEKQSFKQGGALLNKTMTCGNCGWKWKAADGGSDITTCHKCGGQGLVHAQGGGVTKTKLSDKEEKTFQKFYNTLPDNLMQDDPEYDIRGYWDSEGRPEEFNYDQPKQDDGYYHAYSINSNTGEYLKAPTHPTFQHAVDEDRKMGYRPITNVEGRNIAIENESLIEPEAQSFLRNMTGPVTYQDGGNIDAMNAMMKARLAYANEFGNPAAKRMINIPDNPYQFDNGDIGTHYMASYDNYAVPQIQDENGELVLGDYGPESNEAIRFDSDEDANYFAEHYKDVSPGFINAELTDDKIQEYIDGGYIIEDLPKAQLGKAVKAGINFTSNNPLIKSMYKGFNSADFYNPAKGFNPAIFNEPQKRIVHYLKDDDLIMPGFNLNEDMDLKTKSSKLQELLNKPLVPYTKNKLPKNLDLKVINGDDKVRVLLEDAKTKKVYGQLGLQKHDNDWFIPGMIDVHKELWGHKVQDVLYQSGIDAVQNKGYKGIRSGDTLLSPAKTAKAHARFNTEVLGPFTYKYLDDAGVIKDIGITGLTGHKDSDLYDTFFSYYSSLPKNVKDKYSINDLYDKFKNHMSKNKYNYLKGAFVVGGMGFAADTVVLPVVNKDYKSFLLEYSKKYDQQKRDQQLKLYDEKLKKALDALDAYNTGGAIDYELGDEIDEATMQELKELGYTFEKI